MDYVKSSQMEVPAADNCPQAKNMVISVCMRDVWRELLGLKPEECQNLATEDIDKVLDQHFKAVAIDDESDSVSRRRKSLSKVSIDRDHLVNFVEKRGQRRGSAIITHMISALDTTSDGQVTRAEFEALIH